MRPQLITDCDEVLLHMVRHFGVWLGETHEIDFTPHAGDFATVAHPLGQVFVRPQKIAEQLQIEFIVLDNEHPFCHARTILPANSVRVIGNARARDK